MVKLLTNLPLVAGCALAGISLWFSGTGLVHLFAGAGAAIVLMAVAFELGKVAITVHLVRHGRRSVLTVGLSIALVCLSAISSLGIYGYLGRAYDMGRSVATTSTQQVAVLTERLSALRQEQNRLYALIEAVPADQQTNRRRVMARVEPRLTALNGMIDSLDGALKTTQTTQITSSVEVGELRFAAALFGTSQDALAQGIITVLAFLLDPLAVMLLLASGVKGSRGATITSNDAEVTAASYATAPPSAPACQVSPLPVRYMQETSGDSTPEPSPPVPSASPPNESPPALSSALLRAVDYHRRRSSRNASTV